jgi:hypothetical protein
LPKQSNNGRANSVPYLERKPASYRFSPSFHKSLLIGVLLQDQKTPVYRTTRSHSSVSDTSGLWSLKAVTKTLYLNLHDSHLSINIWWHIGVDATALPEFLLKCGWTTLIWSGYTELFRTQHSNGLPDSTGGGGKNCYKKRWTIKLGVTTVIPTAIRQVVCTWLVLRPEVLNCPTILCPSELQFSRANRSHHTAMASDLLPRIAHRKLHSCLSCTKTISLLFIGHQNNFIGVYRKRKQLCQLLDARTTLLSLKVHQNNFTVTYRTPKQLHSFLSDTKTTLSFIVHQNTLLSLAVHKTTLQSV